MEAVHSIEELREVLNFIGKFKTFVNRYGRWLADYPSFYDKEALVDASDCLTKTVWYLTQHMNHHWYCDTCGRSFKFINENKYLLECSCGGDLWLCTYRPPTERCDSCPERFKCLTERQFPVHKSVLDKKHDLMDSSKIIAEY